MGSTGMLKSLVCTLNNVIVCMLCFGMVLYVVFEPDSSDLTLEYFPADIVGFTAWAKDVDPRDVMILLNTLFSSLDRLTDLFKVHKVVLQLVGQSSKYHLSKLCLPS